jgi:heterotetrameric sarcosine oxidase delta subunit
MLRIPCPYCGARDQDEFRFGGENREQRPTSPDHLNDEEWADYLFYRDNTKGLHQEFWVHLYGCRQWFNVKRDTYTHEIIGSSRIGETVD